MAQSLFQLPRPLQRRLTKMYTDTKSSYDFVKEPIQIAEDPELISLHRKLRIQKDRLVSWGLEWSDPSQSPDIDESINKAGLSELVGSVMSTIKEILAEAEPLWQSSKRGFNEGRKESEKAIERDRKPSLIMWDQSRFEDLVRDLTMSIDTLYDLSRTRQHARTASAVKSEQERQLKERSPVIEERQFESTRMQTPHQIDPNSLIWPSTLRNLPPGMLQPAKSPRQIVFMRKTSHGDARRGTPIVPVLLEHAPYDPIYSITGITPSMTRFEKLFAALSHSSDRLLSGLLRLIGYFEEAEHSRFCLLYALPTHFGPVDIETPKLPTIIILSDLLYSKTYEPSLEVKYRLAYNVANAVFDLHAKGVVHGNVVSSNILFIEHQVSPRLDLTQVNLRQSLLSSFDLFSDNATDSSEPPSPWSALHRHALDPRLTRYTHLTTDSKSLDLYSLAMLLLEIGLWTSLPDIFPGTTTIPQNPAHIFKKLSARCGSLFVKAVKACWKAPEDELSQKARPDVMHQKVFWKVSKALDACCAIDEVSDEETESDASPPVPGTPLKGPSTPLKGLSTPARRTVPEKAPALPALTTTTPIDWSEKPPYIPYSSATGEREKTDWSEKPSIKPAVPSRSTKPATTPLPLQPGSKPKPTLRTYPSIRIPASILNHWHTTLIPHINHVLRGFYKKYPESVEISLESIGESPTTTKPTILVICSSVSKVRGILKKGLVYDRSVFGLKVCRGKVVRSSGRGRGRGSDKVKGARRSMGWGSKGREVKNGEFQLRPGNGASIGACVEGRHFPPVSFGGLLEIDGKMYGMSVHHMLDDPDEASASDSEAADDEHEDEGEVEGEQEPILRSSARGGFGDMPDLTHSESSVYSSGDEEYMYELSDYASSFGSSPSDDETSPFDSDYENESEDEEDVEMEAGDIKGIPVGCGEGYAVTQPAIDDVDPDFYPEEETRDEEHLDSCGLGEVYASSGIRRCVVDNITHEIDWALFEFHDHRRPEGNQPSSSSGLTPSSSLGIKGNYPLTVAPLDQLPDLQVHCNARTSGLQTGRILPGMVIVKIYGRTTPSSSFQVAGKGNLGVPGDSGAWVVSNEDGRACGHVLAWSERKHVAYICPMSVLLQDIGETLSARNITFPGGSRVYPALPTPLPKLLPHSSSDFSLEDPFSGLAIENRGSEIEVLEGEGEGLRERDNYTPIRLLDEASKSRIRNWKLGMGEVGVHVGVVEDGDCGVEVEVEGS